MLNIIFLFCWNLCPVFDYDNNQKQDKDFSNHDQLIKGKSIKSFNDLEFSSKKYQYQ